MIYGTERVNKFNFFGVDPKKKPTLETFDLEKEPSVENITSAQSGLFAYGFDSLSVPEDEIELIRTYRRISQHSDIEIALNEIINEVFIFDVPSKRAVEIDFIDETIDATVKKKIMDEFVTVYNLLDFKNKGSEYFFNWYVDGRLVFHKVVDKENIKSGIQKVVEIDSIKIRKIKEFGEPNSDGIYDLNNMKEYYVYIDKIKDASKIYSSHFDRGLAISPEAVCFIESGIKDRNKNIILGYLHKAITPFNNLKILEDSIIIYRVTRAPERRVFYVDVGNLPKTKADQYVKELMNKFKNKMVFDSQTGSIVDKKNVLSMVEDFWLPRREGKGTEVSTLPSGTSTGEMRDAEYFKIKFWQALNVPISRFTEQSPSFMFGKGLEIFREEYRFKKFIDRLRNKFSKLFEDLLHTQLILKKIIIEDDWNKIKDGIQWLYAEDNNFVEFKESEVINNQLMMLQIADPFVGRYLSKEWVYKKLMKLSDEETKQMKEEIAKEPPPPMPDGEDGGGGGFGQGQPAVNPPVTSDTEEEEDDEPNATEKPVKTEPDKTEKPIK